MVSDCSEGMRRGSINVFAVIFILISCLFIAAVLWIPRISISSMNYGSVKQPFGESADLMNQSANRREVERVAAPYINEVMTPQYRPSSSYWNSYKVDVSVSLDRTVFSSEEWKKRNITAYFEISQSIQGSHYASSGLPLEQTIYIKYKKKAGISFTDLYKKLGNYFIIPKDSGNSYVHELKPEFGGVVIEGIWKIGDRLESRAVWDIEEQGIVYFISCRISPSSPLFAKKTCFNEN